MLDRPLTREGWTARAASLAIEGRAFIDGAYVPALDRATFARLSPIDGKVFAACRRLRRGRRRPGGEGGARGVRERRLARRRSAAEKDGSAALRRTHPRHTLDELALLETLDVGKPIANALAVDVPFCANCIQYYAELADKLYDEVAPVGANDVAMVRKEPLGVVGAIVPWNYPLIIGAWKIGPALVAGNSVVLKPAEQSPLGVALSRRGSRARPGFPTASSTSCRASARRPASRSRSTRTST